MVSSCFRRCHRNLNAFYLLVLICFLKFHVIKSQTQFPSRFNGCAHEYNLNVGTSWLQSPLFSQNKNYPTGTACMYRFVAPLDHKITLTCTMQMPCNTELFHVNREGFTNDLSSPLCGSGTVTRVSAFRSLTIAYTSGGSSGRFECKLEVTPQSCDCGWSVDQKIVNGVNAKTNEYPSQAAIVDSLGLIHCSGTIISHRYIVTAAHCGPNWGSYHIVVGDHDLSKGSETPYTAVHQIQSVTAHPGYSASGNYHDIALVKTATVIEWSRGVGPICLPFSFANANLVGQSVDVLGWGTKSFAGPTADILQKITLTIANPTTCAQKYAADNIQIYVTQICTTDSANAGRDSCQKDSGGQVTLRRTRQFLVGIISFGEACGLPGGMGVNTRVDQYLTWITQNTPGTQYCQMVLQ